MIFLFAAKREGVIKALVEVYENEELLAACPVSAVAAAVDTVQRKPSILASAEFEEDQDFTRSFGTDTGEMFGQVFGAPPARDPEPEAKRTEAMTAEAVSKEKELRFEELVQQAQTLRAEGHLDEAVAKVEAALREFPNRRNALVLRVQSKMEQEAAAARPRPPEPGTDAEYADIEDKMASSPSYGPEQMQPSLGFKRPIFLIAAITILLIALLLLFARR